jgi:antitoxin (DNA-binding transcriptional repressor) of toxin-antitoxin stability system
MDEIEAAEAAAALPRLLDAVERGAAFVITRQGRPVARLEPADEGRQDEVDRAIDALRRWAGGTGGSRRRICAVGPARGASMVRQPADPTGAPRLPPPLSPWRRPGSPAAAGPRC